MVLNDDTETFQTIAAIDIDMIKTIEISYKKCNNKRTKDLFILGTIIKKNYNDGYDRVGRTLTSPTSHTTVHAGHAYGGSGQFNIFTPLLIQTK